MNSQVSVVSDLQETMNKVIEATKRQFADVSDGEKIVLKDLLDKVVAETGVKAYKASGIINAYLDSKDSGVEVEAGRNGGCYKGGKPKRVDSRPRCDSCHQVLRTFNSIKNT
jgi:hypothetical protein